MRNEMIDNRLEDALKNRYMHFPIQLDDHWTVVVFDTEGGEWLHYNSMKPVDDSADPYFTVAKRLYSNDCAVAVYNIIRQHIKWEPVQAHMTEEEWVSLRAELVVKYVMDPHRSWQLEHYNMIEDLLREDATKGKNT